MFLKRIDLTADYAVFLISLFFFTLLVIFLLQRASPDRKQRRRIDQRNNRGDQAGELID